MTKTHHTNLLTLHSLFSESGDEDLDHEADQKISRYFYRTGMGLRALSLILSGPSSRGPYNQWQNSLTYQ
ncbi:hypothetical protein AZE42_05457 [Rhizopogon vesiculosus]|uniref:Uncharacterized protein n=1 Tax=Rhizopogon vesiculosus TaxID=180088 RepID=A0A1J8PNH8_9AGAM|nr:hypothetical protein AZE42_05457 [Rhizopogon vesiculosus]